MNSQPHPNPRKKKMLRKNVIEMQGHKTDGRYASELRTQNFVEKKKYFDPNYNAKMGAAIVGGTAIGIALAAIPVAGVILAPTAAGSVTFGALVQAERESLKNLGDPVQIDSLLLNDELRHMVDDGEVSDYWKDYQDEEEEEEESEENENHIRKDQNNNNRQISQSAAKSDIIEDDDDFFAEINSNRSVQNTQQQQQIQKPEIRKDDLLFDFAAPTTQSYNNANTAKSNDSKNIDDILGLYSTNSANSSKPNPQSTQQSQPSFFGGYNPSAAQRNNTNNTISNTNSNIPINRQQHQHYNQQQPQAAKINDDFFDTIFK